MPSFPQFLAALEEFLPRQVMFVHMNDILALYMDGLDCAHVAWIIGGVRAYSEAEILLP